MILAEKLGRLVRTLQGRLKHRMARELDRPFQQLRALRVIDRERPGTQGALAERLGIDAPAASRLVARLEDDGLLERLPGQDRRCVNLKVTSQAKPHLRAFIAGVERLDSEIRGCLTDAELKTFERAIDKITAALSQNPD